MSFTCDFLILPLLKTGICFNDLWERDLEQEATKVNLEFDGSELVGHGT